MSNKPVTRSIQSEGEMVCPWQAGFLIDNYLRRIIHNPQKLFKPYLKEGMTVLDVGCGAGFASLGMAELVGKEGLVISADLQPQMLSRVRRKAIKAGLEQRIRLHQCSSDRIGVTTPIDFALAFFMLHEVRNSSTFLKELYEILKTKGLFFLTEPKMHVNKPRFEYILQEAQSAGFTVCERPVVRYARTVLLTKD